MSISTSERQLTARAADAAKLVLPKATRARLDAAPPSEDRETVRTPP